jgi:hypothetical protein
MTELITAKNILDDMLRGLSHRPSWSTSQRWLLRITSVTLAVFIGFFMIAVTLMIIGIDAPRVLSVMSMGTQVSAIASFSCMLLPGLMGIPIFYNDLRHPERAALDPMLRMFNDEIDLIAQLVCTYERHQLEYAQERVTLEVAHIRSWNAVWFRSLEQVGVLPTAVAAYLAYLALPQLQTSSRIIPGVQDVVIIGAILAIFYLLAMHKHVVCLQLDRFSLVLKHAVQAKQLATPALNANTLHVSRLHSP